MSTVKAEDILNTLLKSGVQVKLLESFDLDVSPASKLRLVHRQMLKCEKKKIVLHLSRLAANEMSLTDDEVESTFHAYHVHHFNCRSCIAAGKGYGKRCSVGLSLWFRYRIQGHI